MKLKDVIARTGLTKKALYYYEEMGLINPHGDGEKGYREYTETDVEQLITLQFLRSLDVSIAELQEMVKQHTPLNEVIAVQRDRLKKSIEHLELRSKIINLALDERIPLNSERILSLNQHLQLELQRKPNYMVQALNRIIPGPLGQLFAIHYGQFLTESLDTPEKQEAWERIVNRLDQHDEISYSEDVLDYIHESYSKLSLSDWNQLRDKAEKFTQRFLDENPKPLVYNPEELEQKLKQYQESPQAKQFSIFQTFVKEHLQDLFIAIDEDMKIISPRFARFHDRLHRTIQ